MTPPEHVAGATTSLWISARPGEVPRLLERGLPSAESELVRALYCATKPIVAMAFLSLLEERSLDIDTARIDPHGRLVADGRWSVADLLWHRTALRAPTIWQALRLPFGSLEGTLDALLDRAAARRSTTEGYSEVLAWYLLAKAGSRMIGADFARALQDDCRSVVGGRLWLAPDRELLELPIEAMTTLVARHRHRDVPLVYTHTARSRGLASPYLGAYGSFTAVVAWFQRLAEHLAAAHGRTNLFPSVAYLRRALEGGARPGQRYAVSLQLERTNLGAEAQDLVGVQAAGSAISVWLDPVHGRVMGVLGRTFLEDPIERTAWLRAELDAVARWSADREVEGWRGPPLAVPAAAWRGPRSPTAAAAQAGAPSAADLPGPPGPALGSSVAVQGGRR